MPNQSDSDAITTQINFLAMLARGCPSGLHFVVAKRHDWLDDNGTARSGFPCEPWREQYLTGPWYFSTGATDTPKSRKRENLKSLRAIVIDDVGTKVDATKVLAKPTWVLETSAGNFQYGFLLDWTDDIHGGDELFSGLIDAKLQDKGVRTSCRLFRLPGSLNDKPGRGMFKAVLTSCDESIVYTLKSLAKALKVKPGKLPPARIDSGERPAAGKDDKVFQWLAERGMVQGQASGGWWNITCPWENEHSPGATPGTRFLPRAESEDGNSHVWCYHGHGDEGTNGQYTRRFFEWVVTEGGPRAEIHRAPIIDEGVRSVLGKIAEAMRPRKETRKAPPPAPDEPADLFNFQTLAEALGSIPIAVLPRTDATKGGYAKVQPVTYGNVEAGLASLGVQARLNLMNGSTSFILPASIDMARFGTKSGREIDGMIDAALTDIFHAVGMRNKKEVRDCWARIANSLYWHPAKDWIEAVKWDGQDRFTAMLGTVDTDTPDLFATYFRRWCLQTIEASCGWAVRRESQKALCLVLAGKQNIGKTRWLMSLAPGFCAEGKHLSLDSHASRDSKHEALQGIVVELGELDTTFKKTAVGSLKAFLSQVTDEYRLPYAPEWLTRPRCTSFCASVNEERFLQDTSGNRRFATVWVSRCDPEHGIDMQQFWAQVHAWWSAGESWWLTEAECAEQTLANDSFQTIDGIVEQIGTEIEQRKNRTLYPCECSLTQSCVARLLGLKYEQVGVMPRVGEGLRKHMGEHRNLRKRGGGAKAWIWWLTQAEAEELGYSVMRPQMPRPDA